VNCNENMQKWEIPLPLRQRTPYVPPDAKYDRIRARLR